MKLKEFDEFKNSPTPENAVNLGKAITLLNISINGKRSLYVEAFKMSNYQEPVESLLSMWATASMLEDEISITEKVLAVRDFLNNPNIDPQYIEEWTKTVYNLDRISKDMLEFIAIDIRNHQGISEELSRSLGHPSPKKPYKKDSE